MGEVDAALLRLRLFSTSNNDATLERPPSPIRITPGPLAGNFADMFQQAWCAHSVVDALPSDVPAVMPATGNGTPATASTQEMGVLQHNQCAPSPVGPALVDCLFVAPTPPLLNHDGIPQNDNAPTRDVPTPPAPAPPTKRQRRRRVFDMSAEFLAMFQGPLPHYIVAALTTTFNLDDDGAEELDEELATVAGDAIVDLQDEAESLQVQALAVAA
ncbi:hypothetical protein PVAP13_1NG359138 [Panicum virgatum]|uniref:Uncharacterized protein n=1 Tax=Panicum virgatum TaxID=38727 RepID=A0A8T0WP23_PANVG|nr:hypothetical protein PVAP13_1NG359138 [Panicum virgatum]